MRPFLSGFLAALVLIPLGVLSCFRAGLPDVQADVRPPAWESRLMGAAVRASVQRSAATLPAPPPATDEQLVEGGQLYVAGCEGCHGGLLKPFREDRSNYPPVPQLSHAGTQLTEPQIYWIVKHGIRLTAMSAYGPSYSEPQLWSIAAFLHRIRDLPPGVRERIQATPMGAGAQP